MNGIVGLQEALDAQPSRASAIRRYAPARQLKFHSHAQARLCYVMRGNFEESIGARRYERRRGMILYRPAGLDHSEQFGRNGSMCGLLTPSQDWLVLTNQFGLQLHTEHTVYGAAAMRLVQTFEHEWSIRDSFSGLSLQTILWESISLLGRPGRQPEPSASIWAIRALEYLHDHSGDSPTLSRVAMALGVHRGHLARVFMAVHGETLGACLRRIRAQRAAALILGTKYSLAEIAVQCGFSHQAHMTRVFRSVFGTTPTHYRR
jgi:AraC family transcriptional regulator